MSDPEKGILRDMEEGEDSMTKYSNLILDFIKREIFADRVNIAVEEMVTLSAALTDLSVSLLAKFRKEPMESSQTAIIGRDVFRFMVSKLGFETGQIPKPSSPYA
jgi:hypothetical protein